MTNSETKSDIVLKKKKKNNRRLKENRKSDNLWFFISGQKDQDCYLRTETLEQ